MGWGRKLGAVSVLSLAMSGAPIALSLAGGAPAGFMNTYFEEHDYGGQHCPGLTWHIDRMVQPDKTINISGPIWYADGSGVSFAKGTGQPDGHFALTVTTIVAMGQRAQFPASAPRRQHQFNGSRTAVPRRDASHSSGANLLQNVADRDERRRHNSARLSPTIGQRRGMLGTRCGFKMDARRPMKSGDPCRRRTTIRQR